MALEGCIRFLKATLINDAWAMPPSVIVLLKETLGHLEELRRIKLNSKPEVIKDDKRGDQKDREPSGN